MRLIFIYLKTCVLGLRITAALRVVSLISRRNTYLYDLQVIVAGLSICLYL